MPAPTPPPQKTMDEYYDELVKSLRGDDPELLLICIRKLKIPPTAYRFDGEDLLSMAISHNCRHCIAPLKNLGFDMNRLNPKTNKHPLEEAMDANSMVVFEMLLKFGANPNAPHSKYGTIIHAASSMRLVDSLIPILISRGGDPNAVASDGSVPLQLAVKSSQVINVEQLLERGANINATDTAGRTPLHLAVMLQQYDPIAYIVLDYGADPTVPDVGGMTPVDLAKMRNEPTLAKILEDRCNWQNTLNAPPPLGNRRPLQAELFRMEVLNAVERGNRRFVYDLFNGRGGEKWKPTAKQSDSPLLTALKNGRFDMAAVMMGYEYGINDRDLQLRNVAHYILGATTKESILLPFLRKVIKVNPRYVTEDDKDGKSPIKAAIEDGRITDPEAIEEIMNQASKA